MAVFGNHECWPPYLFPSRNLTHSLIPFFMSLPLLILMKSRKKKKRVGEGRWWEVGREMRGSSEDSGKSGSGCKRGSRCRVSGILYL